VEPHVSIFRLKPEATHVEAHALICRLKPEAA
jgi:hypothetical protein